MSDSGYVTCLRTCHLDHCFEHHKCVVLGWIWSLPFHFCQILWFMEQLSDQTLISVVHLCVSWSFILQRGAHRWETFCSSAHLIVPKHTARFKKKDTHKTWSSKSAKGFCGVVPPMQLRKFTKMDFIIMHFDAVFFHGKYQHTVIGYCRLKTFWYFSFTLLFWDHQLLPVHECFHHMENVRHLWDVSGMLLHVY